jgi:hypothetical protein
MTDMITPPTRFSRRIPWLLVGFTIWSVAFLALYMVLTLGCAYGWHTMTLIGPVTLQRGVLVVLFGLSLLACGLYLGLTRRRWRLAKAGARQDESGWFFYAAAYFVTLAAFGSIVFTYAPVLALTTCY